MGYPKPGKLKPGPKPKRRKPQQGTDGKATSETITTRGRTTYVLPTATTIDGRTTTGKRFKMLRAEYLSDMGGEALASTAVRALIDRAVSLQLFAEHIETQMLDGKRIDIHALTTATNTLNRVLSTIGIERRARDISTGEQIRRHLDL